MKVWSKGLGKIELIFDFDGYYVEREDTEEGEQIYIKGVIKDPVVWDFRITMTEEDIPGLLMIALDKEVLRMFLKNPKSSITSSIKNILKQASAILEGSSSAKEIEAGKNGKSPDKTGGT